MCHIHVLPVHCKHTSFGHLKLCSSRAVQVTGRPPHPGAKISTTNSGAQHWNILHCSSSRQHWPSAMHGTYSNITAPRWAKGPWLVRYTPLQHTPETRGPGKRTSAAQAQQSAIITMLRKLLHSTLCQCAASQRLSSNGGLPDMSKVKIRAPAGTFRGQNQRNPLLFL